MILPVVQEGLHGSLGLVGQSEIEQAMHQLHRACRRFRIGQGRRMQKGQSVRRPPQIPQGGAQMLPVFIGDPLAAAAHFLHGGIEVSQLNEASCQPPLFAFFRFYGRWFRRRRRSGMTFP